MKQRRARSKIFGAGYEDLERLLEANTYGGVTQRTRRQIPVLVNGSGIKTIWNIGSDIYPSEIELQMTDGKWVRYQMVIEQPGFQGERKPMRWQQLCNELDEILDDRRRISAGGRGMVPAEGKEKEWDLLSEKISRIRAEMRQLRYGEAV